MAQFCYLRHKLDRHVHWNLPVSHPAISGAVDFLLSAFAVCRCGCRIFEEQRQIQRGFPFGVFS